MGVVSFVLSAFLSTTSLCGPDELLPLRFAQIVHQNELTTPGYQEGFEFLMDYFSKEQLRESIDAYDDEELSLKRRRKMINKYPLFRLHPEVLRELARSLTILLGETRQEDSGLRKKDLHAALKSTIPKIQNIEDTMYKNDFLGPIDELRAAAYFVQQGYRVVRLAYDFHLAPRAPNLSVQPVGEIDVVLRDPETDEILIVEVKSKILSTKKHLHQFDRYNTYLRTQWQVVYDHIRKEFRHISGVMVMAAEKIQPDTLDDLQRKWPNFDWLEFPRTRDQVYPSIVHKLPVTKYY